MRAMSLLVCRLARHAHKRFSGEDVLNEVPKAGLLISAIFQQYVHVFVRGMPFCSHNFHLATGQRQLYTWYVSHEVERLEDSYWLSGAIHGSRRRLLHVSRPQMSSGGDGDKKTAVSTVCEKPTKQEHHILGRDEPKPARNGSAA